MNLNPLTRFFARGRLALDPPSHTAGRLLPPASVQRTQLGLRSVDPQSGVLVLRNGEARAVFTVSGVPVHHQSAGEARRFLTRWAQALNQLPEDAVYLLRSRPGGLERDLAERTERSTALATKKGGGLAVLQADQLTHLRALNTSGRVRQNSGYVILREPSGKSAPLLATALRARSLLEGAGLTVALLRDMALVRTIAESWQPGIVTQHWWYQAGADVLHYAPGNARVQKAKS